MKDRPEIGESHGELKLIIADSQKSKDGRVTAVWRCSCGTEKRVPVDRVRGGYVKSCGHLAREAKPGLKHGMRNTKQYRAWRGIKERCTNQNSKDFHRYGGAGITIDATWMSDFESFFAHIGPPPSPLHQVDRIDNTRGYEPGNVRWATAQTQARNKRGAYVWTIRGLVFECASDAARHFDVSIQTVWRWVHGFFDKRRGSFTKKRGDCHATLRY